MNKRQKKKYYKSGRLLLEGREYSRKLHGMRVMLGRDITLDDYIKHRKNIINCALQVVKQSWGP